MGERRSKLSADSGTGRQVAARSRPRGAPASARRSPTRLINSETDIRTGVRALCRQCDIMRSIHARTGMPPLRRNASGFPGLARIIVGQQLSVASAAAIWERTQALIEPFEARRFCRLGERRLRSAGLSAPKIRTLRAVATAIMRGALDLDGLQEASDEVVHKELTAITGIGPWSADMYLMFCIGRADSWAPGDLALQIAVQQALALEARPSPAQMNDIARPWQPWRAVAARMLWSYYALKGKPKSNAPL